jgi:membrane protein implicated in regulation of membrane protease activity
MGRIHAHQTRGRNWHVADPMVGTAFGAYASGVDAWAVWLIIGVAFAVAEVMTLTLVLGMIATGAGAGALAAALGASTIWQLVVFAAVSAALLGLVFPAARRHRKAPPSMKSGTERLIGTKAITLSDVTTASGGRVRIGGETWTARPYDVAQVIPAGEWVHVMEIDGATAVVSPTTSPVAGTGSERIS